MKTASAKFYFLFFSIPMIPFLICSISYANPTPYGKYTFGGGLNLQKIATEIDDDQSPDMCNCIPDHLGGAFKRNGSKRFITQAISSSPITSIYRAYASSNSVVRKVLLTTNGDAIYRSTIDVNPSWVKVSSPIAPNFHWNWVTMNGKAIGAEESFYDNVKQYDIMTGSMTDLFIANDAVISSNTILIRGKYPIVAKNYFVLANVRELSAGSTDYPSRFYFSLLAQPSSMTAQRFIDFRTDDGTQITGVGMMNDKVNFFKPYAIAEWDGSKFDLISRGGDWTFKEIVTGFGLVAPRSLANTGQFYVMASADGIRLWDGGRRSRLTVTEESRIISNDIKPLIEKLIKGNTYKDILGIYYPKREWYVMSYEDPEKFPVGKHNSMIVYDFHTGQWYPLCNMLSDSFAILNGEEDKGQILYGDSNDGYVHFFDVEQRTDDSRKEIVLDTMDSSSTWKGSTQTVLAVLEGTGSLRIETYSTALISSMTLMKILPIGEWYDKTKITKDDLLAFKVYTSSIGNIKSLRVDLEVNDVSSDFDQNFTSVTLSSQAFVGSVSSWTSVEIQLSSFPQRPDWTALDIETVPFANNLTIYGVRFVLTGINISSVSIDDLRVVEATDNPNKMYRFTKMFDFQTVAQKTFGEISLTRDKSPEANFFMDIYNDFGQKVRTEEFQSETPKEIVVLGFNGEASITILNSNNFFVKSATKTTTSSAEYFNGIADKNYIYTYDRVNERLLKVDRSSMSVYISTFGAFGTGTTNFQLVHSMSMDDNNLFIVDLDNHRIKQHAKNDLSYMQMNGTLGQAPTSYHLPTGIANDESTILVANEGNSKLMRIDKSTFGFLGSVRIDYNTTGDTTLREDESFVYMAYNKNNDLNVDIQDVLLEKRDKANLSLISRIRILPENYISPTVSASTIALRGDIALLGKYIFISFTDDENGNGSYYIQKRLKSDFSLVKEGKYSKANNSIIADGLAYKPSTKTERKSLKAEGKYLQIKFYDPDDSVDNNWNLRNQTFLIEPQTITYNQ